MTDTKHTPVEAIIERTLKGPWVVDVEGLAVYSSGSWDHKICDVRGWGYLTGRGALNLDDETAEAIQRQYAALIAAAPKLLEALKELLKESEEFTRIRCSYCAEQYGEGTDAEKAARAAIAKASPTQSERK